MAMDDRSDGRDSNHQTPRRDVRRACSPIARLPPCAASPCAHQLALCLFEQACAAKRRTPARMNSSILDERSVTRPAPTRVERWQLLRLFPNDYRTTRLCSGLMIQRNASESGSGTRCRGCGPCPVPAVSPSAHPSLKLTGVRCGRVPGEPALVRDPRACRPHTRSEIGLALRLETRNQKLSRSRDGRCVARVLRCACGVRVARGGVGVTAHPTRNWKLTTPHGRS